MNTIFDVGANDGIDGLILSFLNRKIQVFAFEPNPHLKKKIYHNKKKLEKLLKTKLINYKLIEKAASNVNKKMDFYITKNDATSSLLKPKKKLDKYWSKHKDKTIIKITRSIKVKKKIKVQTIKLKDFCKKNKITKISYFHCDTQGNDIKVFKGLGQYRNLIFKGVIETALNNKLSLYQKSTTLLNVKRYFKKWGFKIINIEEFHKNNPERNIYFVNKKNTSYIDLKLPSDRQNRIFNRILNNKFKLKDKFYFFLKNTNLFFC